MIRLYFRLFLAHWKKDKLSFLLSIVSLSAGLTFALFALLIYFAEARVNNSEKAEDTYRLMFNYRNKGQQGTFCTSHNFLYSKLKEQIPELTSMGRHAEAYDNVTIFNGKQFCMEKHIRFGDPEFLKIANIKVKEGDPSLMDASSSNILISEDMARKYFGDKDPIGQIIKIRSVYSDWQQGMQVVGVLANYDRSHSFPTDFYLPTEVAFLVDEMEMQQTSCWDFEHYLQVNTSDKDNLEAKINTIYHDYFDDKGEYRTYENESFYSLSNIKQVYRDTSEGLSNNSSERVNPDHLILYPIAALILLLVGIVNYIFVVASHAENRQKEMSMTLILGESRKRLPRRFILENIFFALLALPIALILLELFSPIITHIAGFDVEVYSLSNWRFFLVAILVTVCSGLIPGLYLAIVNLKISPLHALYLQRKRKRKGLFSGRYLLLWGQLMAFALFFILSTQIYNSLQHKMNRDLGFDSESSTILEVSSAAMKNYEQFKSECLQMPEVESVSLASGFPLTGWFSYFDVKRSSEKDFLHMDVREVDPFFFKALKVDILQSRNLEDPSYLKEGDIIMNQEAMKMLGIEQPFGESIDILKEKQLQIQAVCNSFFICPLWEEQPRAAIYRVTEKFGYGECWVRFTPGKEKEGLAKVSDIWNQMMDVPFVSITSKQRLFEDNEKLRNLSQGLGFFSYVIIILAAIGLFGLVLIQMRKEIKAFAIKKVFGGSNAKLFYELVRPLGIHVLLVNILAVPISIYLLEKIGVVYGSVITFNVTTILYSLGLSLLMLLISSVYTYIQIVKTKTVQLLKYE